MGVAALRRTPSPSRRPSPQAAGLEPAGRAIRALGADAEVPGCWPAHGVVAAERAGRLRVSFHVNNTVEEAARVGAVLRGHVSG